MPYERQGFENGQVLEDKHMIAIEDGILELQSDLEEMDAGLKEIDSDLKEIDADLKEINAIEESEILGICK